MAVLMIGEVKGQTKEGFDSMLAAIGETMRQAPGFIMLSGHAIEDGWRVIEVWQSKAEASKWFAEYVAPNLPPGIQPKRQFQELHVVLTPSPS
jgi:quinol monooxygenase YgiN